MPNENIKPIPGYEGYYEITDTGVVYSIKTSPKKVIAPSVDKRMGYLRIRLCKDGVHKMFGAHRLVLLTFFGKCPNRHECGHLNGIPNDNRISNLKWVTRKENIKHRDLHGTTAKGDRHGMRIHKGLVAGEKNWKAKLSNPKILKIKEMLLNGCTQKKVSEFFRVTEPTIWKVANNRTWRIIEDGSVKETK